MSRIYVGQGEAAAGTNKTMLNLISAATIRPVIYDILISSGAAVADAIGIFLAQRFTALGTEGSGFTPHAIDDGYPASLADCGVAHSVEPTYTSGAIMLPEIGIHQRSTFRWVANGIHRGLKCADAANACIGIYSSSHTSTPVCQVGMWWEE